MKKLLHSLFALFLTIGVLAQDGIVDNTFNPTDLGFNIGDGASNSVNTIAIQDDGKIIIGGTFGAYNGIFSSRIARLNSNGTIDTTFDTGTGANNGIVTAVVIQDDGKIIVTGQFTGFNGVSMNRIVRLNGDGSIDTTFNTGGTGVNGSIESVALQADGKIIIGGNFSRYNGLFTGRLTRLNSDGTLDISFNSTGDGPNGIVNAIAIQGDGQIIIGGLFLEYNNTFTGRIARLNTDGTLDTSFNVGGGANGPVYTVAIQADGKILIGGTFNGYNFTVSPSIARINSDGSFDTSFDVGTGSNGGIFKIAIQADSKVVISGSFTSFNGTPSNRLARLNSNGSIDTAFNVGTGANIVITSTVIQTDGKIIVGGGFTEYSGHIRIRIALINSDGSLDPAFNVGTGVNGSVTSTAIQTDGKIIIAGTFTGYNATPSNSIARLNSDGSLDPSFNVGSGTSGGVVSKVAIQTDGKIIIGGLLASYNNTPINNIARLNSDGTLDTTFNTGTGFNSQVNTLSIQADGKIILGGNFTSYNGTPSNKIARLNSDGSLDATFNIGMGTDDRVRSIAFQTDGKIIIGGSFTSYNGTPSNRLARLNSDGSLDASFNIGSGPDFTINSTDIQSDGKIIIGGIFLNYNGTPSNRLARLNSDGSLDSSFNIGSGTNSSVDVIKIQDDGKLIIGGSFTSYNSNTSNSIARLNSDGSLDPTFLTGTGLTSFNIVTRVNTIVFQGNGSIIMSGDFNAYNTIGKNRIVRVNNPSTLSLNDSILEEPFRVYPNPTADILNIKTSLEINRIEIYDLLGKNIKNYTKVNNSAIDLSQLETGLYLVKVYSKDKSKTFKITKR